MQEFMNNTALVVLLIAICCFPFFFFISMSRSLLDRKQNEPEKYVSDWEKLSEEEKAAYREKDKNKK
jgi:hypothetical protein